MHGFANVLDLTQYMLGGSPFCCEAEQRCLVGDEEECEACFFGTGFLDRPKEK